MTIDVSQWPSVQLPGPERSGPTLAVTSVSYGRVASLGNYENERVQASARVGDGESADDVFASLRGWVERRLEVVKESTAVIARAETARYELAEAERRTKRLREQADACLEFLGRHGVEVRDWPDELPF